MPVLVLLTRGLIWGKEGEKWIWEDGVGEAV